MTRKLYDESSFIREFCARVISCEKQNENWAIVLDSTAFFPEGGGQPSDQGSLNGTRVFDVQTRDGVIYHYTENPLPAGEEVTGKIDWERRFDFMQQHSAEHIVSGVAHSCYGVENVGFHLSEDIVTLDFDKPLTEAQLLQVENMANQKVFANVAFNCYYPKSLEGLDYRSKKELEGDVRIVEIEDTDRCACCAPHVKTSGEVGIIKLLDTESLRGGIRIELKAGSRALKDYQTKYRNIKKISSLLAVSGIDAASGVERLLQNMAEQKGEITALKQKRIKALSENFNPEKEITALFEDNLSVKDLQSLADALHKKWGGIRAVLSKTPAGFAFSICGDEAALQELFSDFKSTFEVKGGGRNGMVQGNTTAKKEELITFFHEAN